MEFLLFCDVDDTGRIINALSGSNIIPGRQYDYFFYTTDEGIMEDITLYKVDIVSRTLVKK